MRFEPARSICLQLITIRRNTSLPPAAGLESMVVPRMSDLARAYLREEPYYAGMLVLSHPPKDVPATRFFTSGLYHHDRCGRRVKCFVYWSQVTPTSHPFRIALRSHRTLYYDYRDMHNSRFTDQAVEAAYNVTPLLGRPGDGFCFDTNAIHVGTRRGSAERHVVIFEFDPPLSEPRSKKLNGPCS